VAVFDIGNQAVVLAHAPHGTGNQINAKYGQPLNAKYGQPQIDGHHQHEQRPHLHHVIPPGSGNQRAENGKWQRQHGNARAHHRKRGALFREQQLHFVDAEDVVLLFGRHGRLPETLVLMA
jgi:hypothetical protein